MFQLTLKYSCMFSATETAFNILSEYDREFGFRNNYKYSEALKKKQYSYLDTNNCLWNSNMLYKKPPGYIIVDTIVFKSGIPISWFYNFNNKTYHKTSYKDIDFEAIKKKCISKELFSYIKEDKFNNTNKNNNIISDINKDNKVNLNNLSKLDKINNSTILAYLILEDCVNNKYSIDELTEEKTLISTIQQVTKEHCYADNINYYLNSKKKTNAIFQKFVYPSGNNHYTLEVYWNGHIISVSKKVNNYFVNDKFNKNDKLFLFEIDASNHVIHKNLANTQIANKIKKLCEEIKFKINFIYFYKEYTIMKGYEFKKDSNYSEISNKQILKNMTFHTKYNSDGELVLLYFLELEFKSSNDYKLKKNTDYNFQVVFKVPKQLRFNQVSFKYALNHYMTKKHELANTILCKGCNSFTDVKYMCDITYDMIIKNHEKLNKNYSLIRREKEISPIYNKNSNKNNAFYKVNYEGLNENKINTIKSDKKLNNFSNRKNPTITKYINVCLSINIIIKLYLFKNKKNDSHLLSNFNNNYSLNNKDLDTNYCNILRSSSSKIINKNKPIYTNKKSNNEVNVIPFIIQKLEGNIIEELYLKIKDFIDFRNIKKEVCFSCYLQSTKL